MRLSRGGWGVLLGAAERRKLEPPNVSEAAKRPVAPRAAENHVGAASGPSQVAP